MEDNKLQTNDEQNNKKSKKKMTAKKKKITIVSVVVAVIVVIAALIGINHTAIMADINYAMMPKSITPVVDGKEIVFHVYRNKDFNQFKDKDTPLKAFGFNYIDENGKIHDLSWDKAYTGSKGTKFTPNVWFMLKASENAKAFKSKAMKIVPIIVIVIVVLLIYLWFKSWCKREDARMEKLYGKKEDRHNNNKKSRK